VNLTIRIMFLAGLVGAATNAGAQTRPRFVSPPSLPAPHGYTQVVEIPPGHRLMYLSGQVPLDTEGNVVGRGDFRRQAEQVFANLEHALAAVGATFADVVKLNYYVVDASKLSDLRAVRDRYVSQAAPPASTLVEVRHLFREDVLLEVEAVAAVVGR